ncbi:MAG: hypothetical protein MJZ52_02990 [Bacteroidales bacterium]|nr:hypothetical protein [Bacteroidales bacterium]
MKHILNVIILSVILSFPCLTAFCQRKSINENYNRSSLYQILISHPELKMNSEIVSAYMTLPVQDKYNDHSLSLKYITASQRESKKNGKEAIDEFIIKNELAKRLVSKWFNRDYTNGGFDVNLIAERGNYNASQSDVAIALNSQRGLAMLSDAGENLIGNTFVIFNDVTYVDKEANAQIAKAALQLVGALVGKFVGGAESVAKLGSSIADAISGFTVKIESHLYRLEWTEETSNFFYQNCYYDKKTVNADKKQNYINDKEHFKLVYVGSYSSVSSKTTMRGINKPEDVFRKVLARSIDENIVALQRKFDVFKVIVPVYSVKNNIVCAQIGLKEGINLNSRFEVLERNIDENGKTTYVRKGVIKPIKDKIWDNRFMATEEGTNEANLNYTSFEIVSGKDFYPGMLLREIKF